MTRKQEKIGIIVLIITIIISGIIFFTRNKNINEKEIEKIVKTAISEDTDNILIEKEFIEALNKKIGEGKFKLSTMATGFVLDVGKSTYIVSNTGEVKQAKWSSVEGTNQIVDKDGNIYYIGDYVNYDPRIPENTSQMVDFIAPIWESEGEATFDISNINSTVATIKIKGTDRHYEKDLIEEGEFYTDEISDFMKVYVNTVEVKNNKTIKVIISKTSDLTEERSVGGTNKIVQYGVEYEIKIKGISADTLQLAIELQEGCLFDTSENKNKLTKIILFNKVKNDGFMGNNEIPKSAIEKVTFVNSVDEVNKKTSKTWSANVDGSIIGGYVDSDGNGLYEVYIGSDTTMYSNQDSSSMFANMTNLKAVIDMKYLYTSATNDMRNMFANCESLTELELGVNFRTIDVTNMNNMFSGCTSLRKLDLGPAFTYIPQKHTDMFKNCSNLKLETAESIFLSNTKIKLSTNDTNNSITILGSVECKYYPEWQLISSSLNEEEKKLTINIKGKTNSNYELNISSILTDEMIEVYVDGEKADSIDVSITDNNASSTDVQSVNYEVILSNFKCPNKIEGKSYDEWSGNIALKIKGRWQDTASFSTNVLTDTYGNQNLSEIEQDGKWITVKIKDATNSSKNEAGKMFADVINPNINYIGTRLSSLTKTLTIEFEVVDKYFKASTLSIEKLNFMVLNYTKQGEKYITNWEKMDIVSDKNSLTETELEYGIKYTLRIANFEQNFGENYQNYSGIVLLEIPEEVAEDNSGNKNLATTISIQENDGNIKVDLIDPIWRGNGLKYDVENEEIVFYIQGTDKYFSRSEELNEKNTRIYFDAEDVTDSLTIVKSDTKNLYEDREGVQAQYGIEYEFRLKNVKDIDSTLTVFIKANTLEDLYGNTNKDTYIELGLIDITKPVWKKKKDSTGKEIKATEKIENNTITSTITLEGTDNHFINYFLSAGTYNLEEIRDKIKLYVDGQIVEASENIRIKVDSPIKEITQEKETINGTVTVPYGIETTITVSGVKLDAKQIKIELQEGLLEDKANNVNIATKFILFNCMNSTQNEKTGDFLSTTIKREKIEKIVFLDNVEALSSLNGEKFDLSAVGDNSITGLAVLNSTTNRYTIYIASDEYIHSNNDSSNVFMNLTNLKEFENLGYLKTNNVSNMQYMFKGCTSLNKLILEENFNTSNVTNMSNMFADCSSLNLLDLGPAFTKIGETYNDMLKNCGTSSCTVNVPEAIYKNVSNLKLGTNSTDVSINLDNGGIIVPKYKPEWTRILTTLDEANKKIKVTFEGKVNSDNYTSAVTTNLTENNIANNILVYIDGELATVQIKNAMITTKDGVVTIAIELTDFEETLRQQGKSYTEWSGNISIAIKGRGEASDTYGALVLVDQYGNQSMLETDEASKQWHRVQFSDELTTKNTENILFADFIKPEVVYKKSEVTTVIDKNAKTVTIQFDVVDKYFKATKLENDINGELITVIIDNDETANDVVTKKLTKIEDINIELANGVTQKVGEKYKLVISNIEQPEPTGDDPYRKFSGTLSFVIAENTIEDMSGNMNNENSITLGIEDSEGEKFTEDIIDFSVPTIYKVSMQSNQTNHSIIFVFRSTDRFYDMNYHVTDDNLTIWEYIDDQYVDVSSLYKNASKGYSYTETIVEDGKGQYGYEYRMEIPIPREKEDGELKITIPEKIVYDTNAHYNEQTTFIVAFDVKAPNWKLLDYDASQLDTAKKVIIKVRAIDSYLNMEKSELTKEKIKLYKDRVYIAGEIKVTVTDTSPTTKPRTADYTIEIENINMIGTYTLELCEGALIDTAENKSLTTTITFSKSETTSNNYTIVTYSIGESEYYVAEAFVVEPWIVDETGKNSTQKYIPSSLGEIYDDGKNVKFAEEFSYENGIQTAKSFAGWMDNDGNIYGIHDEIPSSVTKLSTTWQSANVVFVSSKGANSNDGLSPSTAVKSLDTAFYKLSEGKIENRLIVIMDEIEWNNSSNSSYINKPATITSIYAGIDYEIKNDAKLKVSASINLNSDMAFDNIRIYSTDKNISSENLASSTYNNLLICNYHKLIMGRRIDTVSGYYNFGAIIGGIYKENSNIGNSIEKHSMIIESGTYGNIIVGSSTQGIISKNVYNEVEIGSRKEGTIGQNDTLKTTYFMLGQNETSMSAYTSAGDYANVRLNSGTITDLYMSSRQGTINNNVNLNMYGGKVTSLYGGATKNKDVYTSLTIYGGKTSNIYGQGKNDETYIGCTNINLKGSANILASVYGGSYNTNIKGETTISIQESAVINGNIYGGSYNNSGTEIIHKGKTSIILLGGTVHGKVYGGTNTTNTRTNNVSIELQGAKIEEIYAGSNTNGIVDNAEILIKSGSVNYVFGGGYKIGTNNTNIVVDGGRVQSIYGGGESSGKTNNTNITLNRGTVFYVYGGALNANVETTTINKNDTTVYYAIYGGGSDSGITNNSKININSSSARNIYGGGNNGAVTINSTINLSGNSLIYGAIYGGGNNANIGTESSKGTTTINIAGGRIRGDVNGGGCKGIVYGTTNINIGRNAVTTNNLTQDAIEITGYIYGAGAGENYENRDLAIYQSSGETEGEKIKYDYNTKTVIGNTSITIDGENSDIKVDGSIFGAGNASTYTENAIVNIRNFGTYNNIKSMVSIQRATTVNIENSVINLEGINDNNNYDALTYYTLNRLGTLNLSAGSGLLLSKEINMVENYNSLVSIESGTKASVTLNGGVITSTNVINRIYTIEGQKIVFAKNENVNIENEQSNEWSNVNGMTYFGLFAENRNEETNKLFGIYNPGKTNDFTSSEIKLFLTGAYIEAKHKTSHNILIDGFYTSKLEGTATNLEVIEVTPPNSKYYDWKIEVDNENAGVDTTDTDYNVTLIASPYKGQAIASISLKDLDAVLGRNEKNVYKYSINAISLNALAKNVTLVEPSNIETIVKDNTNNKANSTFGLTMETSKNGWEKNSKAVILTEQNGSFNGEGTYTTDLSSTRELVFKLYNSTNITKKQDFGSIIMSLIVSYIDDDGNEATNKILIGIRIKTAAEVTETKYVPMYKDSASNELKYTSDSIIEMSYRLYYEIKRTEESDEETANQGNSENTEKPEETLDAIYKDTDHRVLISTFMLPIGTRINMSDIVTGKNYYYKVDSNVAANTNGQYIYELSKFKEIGTTSNVTYSNDWTQYNNLNNKYQHINLNVKNEEVLYAYEEYDISFDFSETTFSNNVEAQQIYMVLLDSTGAIKFDKGKNIYSSLYNNKNAQIEFTIDNQEISQNTYTLNKDNLELNFDVLLSMNEQEAIDTKYRNGNGGLIIEIIDSEGNRIKEPNISNFAVTVNEITYNPGDDGVIRIDLIEGLGIIKKNIKLLLQQNDVPDGTNAKINISYFYSENGQYYSNDMRYVTEGQNKNVVKNSINIRFTKEHTGLDIICNNNETRIISSNTGKNLAGGDGLEMTVKAMLNSNSNEVITVKLYKRSPTYDDNGNRKIEYTEVDINNYLDGTWISKYANNEYTILSENTSNNNLNKNITFNNAIKQGISTGEYKLEFTTYNNAECIHKAEKTFVVIK